ncbi:snRNA-activating protein complex, subunit 3 [Cinara cedri]|uniref:snRNA-activating protein complex subunit 3 n=1 Tax=Cinara cedri TaxID=506608 RepID=A0A5E4LY70_9HEMI|nr:snRNA-activating protein complex, subunit 3 [Cinara cedri]
MDISQEFLGGFISKPINIRRFKTENSYTIESVKLSKVNERTIMAKLNSINPNIDLSNLQNELKHCDVKLQKFNFQACFDSCDTLTARCLLPIYGRVTSDIRTPKGSKCDCYQTKRFRLYSKQPPFTPRGNIIPGQTILITVSLYHPFHWAKNQIPDETITPHFNESIQLYDTQTLKDLKQAFKCDNVDSEISGDMSVNPNKPLEFLANSDMKQGLFYINKNIYVDSLNDGSMSLSYAETMKKWAQSHGRSIDNILSLDTQLLDLEVCIGEPYIFLHLGRCEHLFIFNEINIAQSSDCLGKTNYPRIISTAKGKLKFCIFCNKYIASIVMLNNDDRTCVTVNHMCETCFSSYNYDILGDKVADFKAFRALKWKR